MAQECLRCGSEKLMHNVPLPDHYGDAGGFTKPAQVTIDGKPEAWIFKETSVGHLSLTICGECGYAELQVGNYRELYEKHLQQLQKQKP